MSDMSDMNMNEAARSTADVPAGMHQVTDEPKAEDPIREDGELAEEEGEIQESDAEHADQQEEDSESLVVIPPGVAPDVALILADIQPDHLSTSEAAVEQEPVSIPPLPFAITKVAGQDDDDDESEESDSDGSDFDFGDKEGESSEDEKEEKEEEQKPKKPALKVLSDDEDDLGDVSGGAKGLRTKNELDALPPVEPINITIPETAKLLEVGTVSMIVEDQVIITSTLPGDVQALDIDTILIFEDKSILGRIFETFGPVVKPMYSVRFNSAAEIDQEKVKSGVKIYYVPDLAKFVFTQQLKAFKGSDASNLYDEEVGEDEIEFSDDEKEMEYKRQRKNKRNPAGGENAGRE
ncbi:H/ACA ribonucleoprotein complex non-core subunit naf1 [Chytridiales sp. JEL 0842]|nr:H/ACA ribonucleoprotein complex non-core subunit naf1 [Chytridiales sp. JEL 0842]